VCAFVYSQKGERRGVHRREDSREQRAENRAIREQRKERREKRKREVIMDEASVHADYHRVDICTHMRFYTYAYTHTYYCRE
jgi:hypothetical protein